MTDLLTREQIAELRRLLTADEQFVESTGAREVSYKWLSRCRSPLTAAELAIDLQEKLDAQQKEIDLAKELSMDFMAWRNTEEGMLSRNATRLMIEADNKRIAAEAENAQLRIRLLSAAGDDLCRLTQEEIKKYTSGEVQIPPKAEFISSCERFHEQIAAGPGVLSNCLTLAQLIAESQRLRTELERVTPKRIVGSLETYLTPGFYVMATSDGHIFDHQRVTADDIDSGITTVGYLYFRIDDLIPDFKVESEGP